MYLFIHVFWSVYVCMWWNSSRMILDVLTMADYLDCFFLFTVDEAFLSEVFRSFMTFNPKTWPLSKIGYIEVSLIGR